MDCQSLLRPLGIPVIGASALSSSDILFRPRRYLVIVINLVTVACGLPYSGNHSIHSTENRILLPPARAYAFNFHRRVDFASDYFRPQYFTNSGPLALERRLYRFHTGTNNIGRFLQIFGTPHFFVPATHRVASPSSVPRVQTGPFWCPIIFRPRFTRFRPPHLPVSLFDRIGLTQNFIVYIIKFSGALSASQSPVGRGFESPS